MEFQIYTSWTELGAAKAAEIERLLYDSFPPNERRDITEIQSLLNGPDLELLAVEENGHIYGMVTVWDLGEFTFLEHFAVNALKRGRGLGTRILACVAEFWDKPTVLEVEYPDGIMEKRRIGFYKRNGYILNDYPYLMPDLSGGNQPVPLLLMSRPALLQDPYAVAQKLYDIPYAGKARPE